MVNTLEIAKASERSWLKLATALYQGYEKLSRNLPEDHPAMIKVSESIDYAYSQADGACRARVGITA